MFYLDKGFKLQQHVFNGCHGVLMMSVSLSDIAILKIHGLGYCCIITGIIKSEAMKLMQNINLSKKVGHCKNLKKI